MREEHLKEILDRYLVSQATSAELDTMMAAENRETVIGLLAARMEEQAAEMPLDMVFWAGVPARIVEIDKPLDKAGRVLKLVSLRRAVAAAAILLLGWLGRHVWRESGMKGKPVYEAVSVGRGGNRTLTLPDGTQVWLNAVSSIRWERGFTARERRVELTGEAFFKVSRDDRRPFLVTSGGVTTTVLGTSFDVAAYSQQVVSVSSGKVRVQSGGHIWAVLERGRQVRITGDTSAIVREIDTGAIGAWTNGLLVYKDESLDHILSDLARHFTDSVELRREVLRKTALTLAVDRKAGIRKALEMICRITNSHLREEGRGTLFIIE